MIVRQMARDAAPAAESAAPERGARAQAKSLGVTIEAQYTVGEYDILILSAQQSSGLETWLRENGYRIPPGAASVLTSYIKQNLKFFVAKVNLQEQAKLGYSDAAADSGRVRVAEIHAADSARDGQRRRAAGAVRLRADAEGARRSDELPHREAADRHGPAGLREGSIPRLLQGDVLPPGGEREHEHDLHRVRLGHGLVRSVRGGSAVGEELRQAGRLLARRIDAEAAGSGSEAVAESARVRKTSS